MEAEGYSSFKLRDPETKTIPEPKSDAEIISILEAYKEEYRSSHGPFESSDVLDDIYPKDDDVPGTFSGPVSFLVCGHFLDGSQSLRLPIQTARDVTELKAPTALFILLMEDRDILFEFSRFQFQFRIPCIMVAPPERDLTYITTRLFLKKLHCDLQLPVLAVGSCRPRWLDALNVYRTGRYTDGAPLGIPDIHWLGMTPMDVLTFGPLQDELFWREPMRFRGSNGPNPWSEFLSHPVPIPEELPYPRLIRSCPLMTTYLPIKLQEKDWIKSERDWTPPVPETEVGTRPLRRSTRNRTRPGTIQGDAV